MKPLSELKRIAEAAKASVYDLKAWAEFEDTFDQPTISALLSQLERARDALQRVVACQNVAGPNSLHNAGNWARSALAAIQGDQDNG